MKILLTGSSGLVGSRLLTLLRDSRQTILAPTHKQLDILNRDAVARHMKSFAPDIIIHSAAYTNATKAELERGNIRGQCFQVNVVGTRHILDAAKLTRAFVIFFSTASVFTTQKESRVFGENDRPSHDNKLSWYAVTKKRAEALVKDQKNTVIMRLSHPVSRIPGKDDYLRLMLGEYKAGKLYALFPDQKFSVTLVEDLAVATLKLCTRQRAGIYHVTSTTACSPHELISYALQKTSLQSPVLKTIPFAQFQKTVISPLRYSQYHVIMGKKTAKALKLPSRSWRQVIDCAMPSA